MNLFTESIRVELLTNSWRHHSESELILLDDLGGDSLKVDKITEFSVRIPELRNVIDRVGDCFRWFTISNKRTKEKTEKWVTVFFHGSLKVIPKKIRK